MRKTKKKILDLESKVSTLSISIGILNENITRQNRAIRFLSTHDKGDIVIRPNRNILEVEYCGPSGFNIAIFIDSYLSEHITSPVITHSNNDKNAVFSINDQIYVLDKIENSIKHVVE